MRFLCITAILVGLTALCLTPESAQARGRRGCRPPRYAPPIYFAPPMYAAPRVYSVPPMYAPPRYAEPRAYAQAPLQARPTTTVTVGAYDNYFEPKTLNVQPGTTVKWVNYGQHEHTVTSNDGRWDSGDIAPGAAYSATFQQPGTYYYYCRHHQGMRSSIVVGRSAGSSRSSDY